jgi:hypothetical protein
MALKFRDNDKAGLNTLYKPPQKIQDDRQSVYLRYTQMQNGRSKYDPLWDKWEKQWEGWRPPKDADDWQSNIVPPFTTTIVERALAEMVDQTVQPTVTGRGPEDVPKAKVLNYVKDYTWEIGDGDLQLYSSLKQALILGKTIWQEDYWQDKREVKVLTKFDLEKNEETYIKKEVFDFDDVYGETIDLRNFFNDEMARTINMGRYKANDCIRRFIMNYDSYLEWFPNSINDQFGVAKLVKPGGDLNYYQFYQPPTGIDKDNQVEVLFYWGRRPDKLIIVANDLVIRDGPNPYNHKQLPFAEGSDVPRLNQFYAKGEPELLESIQDELTTMRRMRIDRQHMDIWKMFLVSNRETLDEDEAIIAPSRFLYVDDPANSIKALDYRDVSPTSYREEELLKQDGRQVTGVESPQSAGTATEAAIFKEATMKSLRMKIWLISRELLTNIIRLRVPNIVQFYSVPKAEKLIGEKKLAEYRQIRTTDIALETAKSGELIEKQSKGTNFFIVSPDMIIPQYGGYDYKLSAEPTFPISKPLMQQKVNELMQHPVIQGAIEQGYYGVGKVADEMMELNDFDPEKFKNPQIDEQTGADEQVLLELANRENEILVKGTHLEPTAYAPRSHTQIHLAFMSSEAFKQAPREVLNNFVYHVYGEGTAQELRAKSGAGVQSQPTIPGPISPNQQTAAQGVEASPTQATMPARAIGPTMMGEGVV